MATVYSSKLTMDQNAALERFEGISSCPPYGIEEFERGEISAGQLWAKNVGWINDVAIEVSNMTFPE